jgi:hypothetical protein
VTNGSFPRVRYADADGVAIAYEACGLFAAWRPPRRECLLVNIGNYS